MEVSLVLQQQSIEEGFAACRSDRARVHMGDSTGTRRCRHVRVSSTSDQYAILGWLRAAVMIQPLVVCRGAFASPTPSSGQSAGLAFEPTASLTWSLCGI